VLLLLWIVLLKQHFVLRLHPEAAAVAVFPEVEAVEAEAVVAAPVNKGFVIGIAKGHFVFTEPGKSYFCPALYLLS
jgi:hypothetical protein